MNPPKGYHKIKVYLVFAVKFDGRHKARLVADCHLTLEPVENIYSGVVSLRNLRLVIFLGKPSAQILACQGRARMIAERSSSTCSG